MYRRFIARRVLLIVPSGTIDGTLSSVDKEGLVVDHATFVAEGAQAQPMDGQVLVPHASIEFAQVV